jgi:PAS domain S-box-containing protein
MKLLVKSWIDSLSLGTRITLGALLLFALATLVQIYLISTSERSHVLAELGNRLDAHSKFMASELQGDIDELRNEALFMSYTPPAKEIIQASLKHGTGSPEYDDVSAWKKRLAEVFTAFINANSDYFQVRYIGVANDGLELVRVDRVNGRPVVTTPDRLQKKGDRDYFQAALKLKPGEVYLSEINLNREWGKVQVPHVRTLRAATAVYAPDGKLYGIMVINMNIGPALDRLAEGTAEGIRAYLVNSEGDYLVHPEQSRSFGFDLGKRYRWQDEANGMLSATGKGLPSRLQTFSLSGETLEGVARELHFDRQQPQRFLTLVYAMPNTVIHSHIAATRNVTIASAVGVAIFVGLLLYLYVRRSFAPLAHLTESVRAIGAGSHDTPLPEKASGEIGALVQAFNGMLAGLSQREWHIRKLNQELEQRVEKRTAELQQATESMREALATLDASLDAAFIFDPETLRFSYVNQGATRQLWYSREELLQMTPVDIKPEIDEQRFREMIAPLVSGEQQLLSFETTHRRKDGVDIPVEVNLQYVIRPGSRARFIAIVRDVTERWQAEEEQEQLNAQLAASNRELSHFAYIASHDLQEPLRTVASYLQLIERRYKDKLDDAGREFIDFAVDGANRMQGLIRDLLEFSRVQTQGMPFAEVDLDAVLAEVVADLKTGIEETGAAVTHDPLPVILGDAGQLRRLLLNLIGNAIKYRGEAAPRIHVSARRIEDSEIGRPGTAPDKGWLISVSDNGIGIEAQYFEKVFQLFQRLHTREKYPGTGLGLALCKRIVERHGGAIWVESTPGGGSIFHIALPIKAMR